MYFEWKKMPDVADTGGGHFPVAIVGGGPIGLGMAQALACRGIESVVLEARDQVSDGSRAVALTRRTLQIFDAIGIGADVLQRAITWNLNSVYYGTRQV